MATTVATIGASGAAVAALWFSGQSLRATNEQHTLSQQTAVTDRFRLAAEQLASDQINVRLSGIYLFELADTSLGWTDLTGADLTGANLEGAELRYADLTGANFTEADLTGVDLTGAVYDETTVWPAGFTPAVPE
ncbi:pentapeptide repeat-containing protein [Nocardia sp. NPDC001965]